MTVGRVVSALATAGAVCGCAVLAVSMARAAPEQRAADRTPLPSYSVSRSLPAYRVLTPGPATTTMSSAPSSATSSASSAARTAAATMSASHPARSSVAARTSSAAPQVRPATSSHPSAARRPAPTHSTTTHSAPKAPSGSPLPLPGFYTGNATRVITVRASSYSSTTAVLQAWTKAAGGGWNRVGSWMYARVGSQGLTTSPSESKSATPIGSFSLTQAFGAYSDPGTALPYFKTNSADWWISQSGPLYNTHQHCWSGCAFTRGSPNEHLYYETPYYNYAVVIDYNRFPVHQGAGSAFFLHVSVGSATAGCVAIPQSNLVSIMRWLTPSAHPRILIGVA